MLASSYDKSIFQDAVRIPYSRSPKKALGVGQFYASQAKFLVIRILIVKGK